MPGLQDALNADLSGYVAADAAPKANLPTPNMDLQPGRSNMMRCPLPAIWQSNPDSLRSYYLKGQVPQTRLLSPVLLPPLTGNGGASTTNVSVISGGSGGGGDSGNLPVLSKQATIKTAVIGPNMKFVGIINITQGFQLLSVSVGSPCRVQLYGTAAAQSADLSRGLDVPPPAGTAQNIITDVVLDTLPLQWSFQDRIGANGDNPQKGAVYVTITNLDVTSDAVTLSIMYVPLES